MKILFVAVFTPKSTNIWQAKGFEALGHQVYRFDYRSTPHEYIHEYIKKIEPDAVIFAKCNKFDVKYVKMFSCKKVLWYPDLMGTFDKELQLKVKACDVVFCSTPVCTEAAKKINPNSFQNYGGYEPDIHKPVNITQDIDVSFIGSSAFDDRKQYINKCNITNIQGVYGIDHSKAVSRSRINVNFCHSEGTSNRLYKIMAAGGFVLTQNYPGLENDFNIGVELDVFNNPKELKQKIAYYLNHESLRKNIAANGMLAVKKYDHIHFAKRIIKKI